MYLCEPAPLTLKARFECFLPGRKASFLGLVLALSSLVGIWSAVQRYVDVQMQRAFDLHVNEHIKMVERELASYEKRAQSLNEAALHNLLRTLTLHENGVGAQTQGERFVRERGMTYAAVIAVIGMILCLGLLYIIVELWRKRILLKAKTIEADNAEVWLKQILAASTDAIHVLSERGDLVVCSDSFLQMLGYDEQAAKGLSVFDWERGMTRTTIEEMMGRITDRPTVFESRFERKDGSLVDVEVTARVFEKSGKRYRYASARDIGERKKLERQMLESERFYRSIFASVDEAIIIVQENRIIDCNEVALRLFEKERTQMLGEEIARTMADIECRDCDFERYLSYSCGKEQLGIRCSMRLEREDASSKIVELTVSRLGDEEERKMVMIARDVTRNLEEERLMTMQARQAQTGEMISMIAHRWRQPLAIINAVTSQLRLRAMIEAREDAMLVDSLIKIEEQTAYLSQTISSYRDFFRPDKTKEYFRVLDIVEQALELMDHTLKSHAIEVCTTDVLQVPVYTFRNELLQVLLVLLKNAYDAFVRNRIKGGWVRVGIDTGADGVCISVRDNAGGISSEVKKRLFSPYITTKHEGFGTGLGLYMSQIIIHDHCGGSIEGHSEGEETLFTIRLPYLEAENGA